MALGILQTLLQGPTAARSFVAKSKVVMIPDFCISFWRSQLFHSLLKYLSAGLLSSFRKPEGQFGNSLSCHQYYLLSFSGTSIILYVRPPRLVVLCFYFLKTLFIYF